MDLPTRASAALAQGLQEHLPVGIPFEDDLPMIPTAHHMIDRSLILDSNLPRHGDIVAGNAPLSIVRTDTFSS